MLAQPLTESYISICSPPPQRQSALDSTRLGGSKRNSSGETRCMCKGDCSKKTCSCRKGETECHESKCKCSVTSESQDGDIYYVRYNFLLFIIILCILPSSVGEINFLYHLYPSDRSPHLPTPSECTNRQAKDASTDEEVGEDSAAALNGTFSLGGPLADRNNAAAAGGAVGGREEKPLKRPRLLADTDIFNASDEDDTENIGIMKPFKFDLGMS